MKITSIYNTVTSDIHSYEANVRNAIKEGISIGNRTALVYKQNNANRYMCIARSATDKIVKNTTVRELPYIGGALGMLVPLPLFSPLMMALGFIIRGMLDVSEKFKKQ